MKVATPLVVPTGEWVEDLSNGGGRAGACGGDEGGGHAGGVGDCGGCGDDDAHGRGDTAGGFEI